MKINLSKKNYVISAGADGLGFAIANKIINSGGKVYFCLLYTSPSPRDLDLSRMPSSA